MTTSGKVLDEPRFSLAPYIGDMTEKQENAARSMTGSQHVAIQKLRWIREKNGLSQREVARKMGSAASVVCYIENGKIDPRISTLRRYALACGAEISFNVSEA